MKKVLILVEGQTEEAFVKRVLAIHLAPYDIVVNPIILTTKIVVNGPDFKGGSLSYRKVKKEAQRLLGDTSTHLVTTMLDFYGLKNDFPMRDNSTGNPLEKVSRVEAAFNQDIDNPRFYSYFSLHEYEGLLFSSPSDIARIFNEPVKESILRRIRNSFPTPEDINDNPETVPSKRICMEFPQYEKVFHGSVIAGRIGLETMRRECHHFHTWLNRIEQL
ncbi:MAG: DUF4276 family protein [Candidatus Latescibacter sp.]|nr:DUF4276 family protein [Candidatus Latescibacter sp.]